MPRLSPVSWPLSREEMNSPRSNSSNLSNEDEVDLNYLRLYETPGRSRNFSQEQPPETAMRRARVSVRTLYDDPPVVVE